MVVYYFIYIKYFILQYYNYIIDLNWKPMGTGTGMAEIPRVTHDIPYTQHHTLFPYHLFPLFSSFRGMSISNISPTIGQEIVKPLFE